MADWVSDWVVLVATGVIAISASVSAWLTWRLSQDNRALRKAGTEPEVVAYLARTGRYGAFFQLVLENVGQGPAQDVEIFVDASPPDFAGFNLREIAPRMRRTVRRLLPQGERVELMMAVHHELFKDKGENVLPPFHVDVTYTNLRGAKSPGQRHLIDVSEFSGSFSFGSPEEETANAVKKIESHLEGFASGFKRLHVETITTADREAREWADHAAREWELGEHKCTTDRHEPGCPCGGSLLRRLLTFARRTSRRA